jgi:SAM-dependent methyltransferase
MTQADPYGPEIARIYDLIVYGRTEVETEGAEWDFLKAALDAGSACDVLDVGCGTGRHLAPLARAGFRVTGLDISQGMIDECRRRTVQHGLDVALLCGDIMHLERNACYDAVLAMDSVICYLPDADAIVTALTGMRRALRPGGLLVLDNHNFLALHDTFDRTATEVVQADGVRISYTDTRWYDDFPSIFHVEVVAQVQESDGRTYELRNEEVLRAMTSSETVALVRQAGFDDVRLLSGYEPCAEAPLCSDRIIVLAR